MTEPKRMKITDLTPDRHNANKGTERGQYMLDHSIEQYGVGRSILIDKDGELIAGNKTLQAYADMGFEDVIVIPSDGKTLIAVQRTDMDLDDVTTGARGLAYADNRASEVGLAWDAEQLLADMNSGVDLAGMFREDEIDRLLGNVQELNYDEMWQGMPEFEQDENKPFHSIQVHFKSLLDIEIFAKLIKQTVTEKTTSLYFPKVIK